MTPVRCLFVGHRPDPSRFRPPSMAEALPSGKPTGGLWTCRDTPGEPSAWADWCAAADHPSLPRPGGIWRLTAEDPLIYTIDSWLAFQLAADERPHRWRPSEGWDDPAFARITAGIDYAAMAEVYDAVELTRSGLAATRYRAITMYGWDVPTILWLRWCFTAIEPVGQP